jgi:4-hydroxy-tetrahydrodipicolinate synthase
MQPFPLRPAVSFAIQGQTKESPTMREFRGLYPPLITPFDAEGNLDEQALRDHVDFVIDNGADGFCAGSSTGEFMNLTRTEWEQVLQICKEQNDGRVPMIAGTADMATAATIERSRFAASLGCDGLLIVPPWYQVHTMREVYAHYKAVHEAVPLPIMIYNNPPVTGIDLTLDVLTRLANDGIVQYIKDANSDPFMLARLRMTVGDKIRIFYGHDNNALGAFAFGATGWVSGSGNFDPARWSRIVHLCIDDGDFVEARKLWYEIMPFVDLVTVGRHGERPDWIAAIKRGMELRGRRAGTVRPPMLPLTEEVYQLVKDAVEAMTF